MRIILKGQPLTKTEKIICDKIVAGMTNKEIADDLGVSPRTVEDHRKHTMVKYGVRNAVELTRKVYGISDLGPAAHTTFNPEFIQETAL